MRNFARKSSGTSKIKRGWQRSEDRITSENLIPGFTLKSDTPRMCLHQPLLKTRREDGQFLITEGACSQGAAGLSALHFWRFYYNGEIPLWQFYGVWRPFRLRTMPRPPALWCSMVLLSIPRNLARILRALTAPAESKRYSPVGLPSLS